MNGEYKIGDVVLGSWTLVKLLGEGAYGKVYEAHREDFGTTYTAAIKIMTIPQSQSEVESARAEGMDEESVTSYFRSLVGDVVQEFALMSELKGTANIVSYEDHSVRPLSEGIGWDILIRMELLTPMIRYMEKHPMTRSDVIKLGIDMCKALELCQRYNIIHRDIKPENIFVSRTGDYKLGDFGVARTLEKTTGGLSKKGTYTYMAPEIYRDEKYGSTVDIYSLGIVLYRLLNNNRAPFLPQPPQPITHSERERALVRRISGEALPPPANAEGRLAEIVLKACAYEPKDRYSSPLQMRQELEAIQYRRADDEKIYGKSAQIDVDSTAYTRGGRMPSDEDDEKTVYGGRVDDDEKTAYTGKKPSSAEIVPDEDDKTVYAGKRAAAGVEEKAAPKKKKTGLIAAVAVALVAIAAALIFLLPKGKTETPAVSAAPTPQPAAAAEPSEETPRTPAEDTSWMPDLGSEYLVKTSPQKNRADGGLLLCGIWEKGELLVHRIDEKAIRIRYESGKLSSQNGSPQQIYLTATFNFDAEGTNRLDVCVYKAKDSLLAVGYAFYEKNARSGESEYFYYSTDQDWLFVDLEFPESFAHTPDEIKTVKLIEDEEQAMFFSQPKAVNANAENRSLLQNVTVSDKGIASWDPYPGAASYSYTIGDQGRGTNKTSLNLLTETKSMISNPKGVYAVNIRADAEDIYDLANWYGCYVYSDVDLNAEDVVPNLEGAVLGEDGVLTWDPYPGASEYIAKINSVQVGYLYSATSFDTGGALVYAFGQRSDPCLISIEAQGSNGRVLARWRYLYTLPELPLAEEEEPEAESGWITVDTTGKEGELTVLSYYVSDGKKISDLDAFKFQNQTWLSFEWVGNTTTYVTRFAEWGTECYTDDYAREQGEFYARLWKNDLVLPNNPENSFTSGFPDAPDGTLYVLCFGMGKDGKMDCYLIFELGIPQKNITLDEKWSTGGVFVSTIDSQTLHVELTDERIPYGFPHSETPGKNYETWGIVLDFGENRYGYADVRLKASAKTLADVVGSHYYMFKGSYAAAGKEIRPSLSGNTFFFDMTIPASTGLSVNDIETINVNQGTETENFVDNHSFYID